MFGSDVIRYVQCNGAEGRNTIPPTRSQRGMRCVEFEWCETWCMVMTALRGDHVDVLNSRIYGQQTSCFRIIAVYERFMNTNKLDASRRSFKERRGGCASRVIGLHGVRISYR